MNAIFYAFEKKKNSTARPGTGVSSATIAIELKDDTSVLNPVLIMTATTSGMPNPFNPSYYTYVHIPSFSRYYFVDDVKYVLGHWEFYLSIDVLATYKPTIGTTTAYVERSASTSNGDIIDNLYPAKTDVQITSATISTSWANVAPSGGCYVIGVINYQNGNHIGAVTYYATDTAGLNSLLGYLFGNNIYQAGNITEIGEGLFKSIFNPFQYIVSCMWFPAAASRYGSTSTTIKVGYWDTGVTAVSVSALLDNRYIDGTIPDHPQAATRGDFLNFAPYTRITLFCPPFGEVPIDATFTRVGKYLHAKVMIDVITGQATLRVAFRSSTSADYSYKACVEKTAMMGVPIQLAQVLSDYSGSVNTLSSGISGGIAGAIMGMIGATVQSAIATQAPKVSTNGANGSFINFGLQPELVVEHMKLVDEDNIDLGRPLMSTRTINTLSGYIKCADAHFDASCFGQEKDMVNEFMNNGFFYE